jgi:hypothetical protein
MSQQDLGLGLNRYCIQISHLHPEIDGVLLQYLLLLLELELLRQYVLDEKLNYDF